MKLNFNSGSHLKNYVVKVIKNNTGWVCNGARLTSTCNLIYEDELKVQGLVKWAINSKYNLEGLTDTTKRKRLNRQLDLLEGKY